MENQKITGPVKKLEDFELESSYASLGTDFHSPVLPTPFSHPFLAASNPDMASFIGLDPAEAARPDFADYFCGKTLFKGSRPVAMRYTGHQFGVYNPDIGDGRAILLGEAEGADGRLWDFHLKGGGRSAYSRSFDGRAVLRSCIREYLCGEAMHGLGIPTTRSLCIIGSDEKVSRERTERAAMLLRMGESHVRFGSFEALFYTGDHAALKKLADYVISRHFEYLENEPGKYLLFFREVVRRTAVLIAHWQAAGFTHGVMNTDNMSILGMTIDYGPYGFMEEYDPSTIPNHSDEAGRYAFDRQPPVALWNLTCLAQALSPLFDPEKAFEAAQEFVAYFETEYSSLMRRKLGLLHPRQEDALVIGELLGTLHETRTDYTLFFRALSALAPGGTLESILAQPGLKGWLSKYRSRVESDGANPADRREIMSHANPRFILRNYMAQTAIAKADENDFSEIEKLRVLLSTPFHDHPEMAHYAGVTPEWGKSISVSCSS